MQIIVACLVVLLLRLWYVNVVLYTTSYRFYSLLFLSLPHWSRRGYGAHYQNGKMLSHQAHPSSKAARFPDLPVF